MTTVKSNKGQNVQMCGNSTENTNVTDRKDYFIKQVKYKFIKYVQSQSILFTLYTESNIIFYNNNNFTHVLYHSKKQKISISALLFI